jgi:hypothetical protein
VALDGDIAGGPFNYDASALTSLRAQAVMVAVEAGGVATVDIRAVK